MLLDNPILIVALCVYVPVLGLWLYLIFLRSINEKLWERNMDWCIDVLFPWFRNHQYNMGLLNITKRPEIDRLTLVTRGWVVYDPAWDKYMYAYHENGTINFSYNSDCWCLIFDEDGQLQDGYTKRRLLGAYDEDTVMVPCELISRSHQFFPIMWSTLYVGVDFTGDVRNMHEYMVELD